MREPTAASVVNYTGPDESVECAYPGCTNRLRQAQFTDEPQFCSMEHAAVSAERSAASLIAGIQPDCEYRSVYG